MNDQPRSITLQDLLDACAPGGASVLTSVTELAPAAGPHALVAPPRYLAGREPAYSFSKRAVGDSVKIAVLLDSKGSQGNRRETCIADAIKNPSHPAHNVASRLPRVVLEFPGVDAGETRRYLDNELPHRWADGHIRAGFRDGKPVTQTPEYRALRNSTPADASVIFNASPMSLVDGVWDSSRKSNQVRLRSAMVGEIVGILADQSSDDPHIARRGGARVDPIAASVQLDGKTILAIADRQKDELSAGTYAKIQKDAKDAAKKMNSGSTLGLGAVPPSLNALGGVACTNITRSTVLSFATLRQLRFGGSPEQDVAFRALLASYALLSMALADEELFLRADCDLVESAPRVVTLDGRYGRKTALNPIESTTAIALVSEALTNAESFGLTWDGQELVVQGDASILSAAVEDSENGEN